MKMNLFFLTLMTLAFALCGCFSGGFHLPSRSGGPPVLLTPFQQEVSNLFTPLVWACFIGGVALIALAVTGVFVIPFLSARTSAACGVGAMVMGLTLMWVRDFIIDHPWVVPAVAVGLGMFIAWPWVHRQLVKARAHGQPDNSTPLDQLKALVPGLGKAIPTLSDPTTKPV